MSILVTVTYSDKTTTHHRTARAAMKALKAHTGKVVAVWHERYGKISLIELSDYAQIERAELIDLREGD